MFKTILKLVGLCVIFNAVVFGFQPSPFAFGILTGLLVGAAFIVGNKDGIEYCGERLFAALKQWENDHGKVE